jgi:nitrate reductase molybdenum cofactor assembly chaperone
VALARTKRPDGGGEVERGLYVELARLLDYPSTDLLERLENCRQMVRVQHEETADLLGRFSEELAALDGGPLDLRALEELHLRTFDAQPQCIPYLSVHLFGDESFQRAKLMIGLSESYQRAGFDSGTELPDHLAVVLRSCPSLTREEWVDMTVYCLRAPIDTMVEGLVENRNPYRHLLMAIRSLLNEDIPEDIHHV